MPSPLGILLFCIGTLRPRVISVHCICMSCTGGCHSHRLHSHSCDRTQSMVNGQTIRISTSAVNGQSRVGTFKSQCGTDQISAVIRSEPDGEVTHARKAYFLMYRLADLANIETSLRANILAVKDQWPKISMVNGQTVEKSRSKF